MDVALGEARRLGASCLLPDLSGNPPRFSMTTNFSGMRTPEYAAECVQAVGNGAPSFTMLACGDKDDRCIKAAKHTPISIAPLCYVLGTSFMYERAHFFPLYSRIGSIIYDYFARFSLHLLETTPCLHFQQLPFQKFSSFIQELIRQTQSSCVFEDVLDRVDEKTRARLISGSGKVHMRAVLSTATYLDAAWCHQHNKHCKFPAADIDMSGTPCVEDSNAGSRKTDAGASRAAAICHMQHVCKKAKIVALENVCGPDISLTSTEELEHTHEVRVVFVRPEDCGLGAVRRDRGWTIGVNRTLGRWLADPQDVYDRIAKELSLKQVHRPKTLDVYIYEVF